MNKMKKTIAISMMLITAIVVSGVAAGAEHPISKQAADRLHHEANTAFQKSYHQYYLKQQSSLSSGITSAGYARRQSSNDMANSDYLPPQQQSEPPTVNNNQNNNSNRPSINWF